MQEHLNCFDELSVSDPRNRRQYYELTLQLALQSGNTVAVRDLIVKLLNSPSSARELYTFSLQLQSAGYTQHAAIIMNKAMHLAMAVRNPNFLMELSRHLEDLGRGQDSVQIAERALRFANQRDRYGRTMSSRNLQQAIHLTSHSKTKKDQEPQLIDAVQKNPTSYRAFMNLAAFYEGTNKFDKASTAYRSLLTIRPTDSGTRKRFADMLYANGKYEAAVPQYTKLLKDNPTILGYATSDVIETFFKAKKVDELITLSKEMITPSIGRDLNNELARDVARELMDRNNPKAAIAIYEKLIEAQPSRTGYYRSLASAYAAAGEHEKAIQILRNTLETYSQEDTIGLLTRFYKLYGGLDAFIKESEAKLAEKPTDNNLRYLLAAMKIAANDLEGADRLAFQLLNEDAFNTRHNTRQLHNLADAYRLAGVREREFQILERIVQVQNQQGYVDWVPYHRLGMIYALKGEIGKAQDAYRKMGRLKLLYRNDYVELMNVGATYLHNQMWDEAEPLLTEIANDLSVGSHYRRQAEEQLVAIKKRRDNISNTTQLKDKIKTMDIKTLRTLAKNFVQRGDRQQAVFIYTHLEKVMPEDFESRAQLATLYTTQNQHDNAVATWKALLAEDPGNTKFQDGLVRTYQSAGKIDKALELSQQYIKTDANNSVNYVRLAKLYADDDRIDEAIAAYQKSIELAPGNVKHHLELAALYIRKDDKVSAETAFQEAKRYTAQEWERHDIEQEIMKLSEEQENFEGVMQKAEVEGTLTFEMQKEHAETFRDDGKHEEASIAYEKALEMTTDSYQRRRIYENLLDIYPKLDKHDAALEMHDELAFIPYIANAAESARNRLMKAYKNENKLDVLKSIYNTKLENDSNNINYLEMLAEIYKSTNAHGKAAEAYQAIGKLQPDNALSYYNAAAAYNRNGQSELAKEMLNRGESVLSVSTQKRSSSLLETLSQICYDGKMYDLAIKFADSAIAESIGTRVYGIASPVETEYKLLAKSLLAAKRYEEAVHAYQQVENMARYPWDRDEARKAIESASRVGNLYEKQISKLLKKVQENRDDPEARLTLAQTYEKADKIEEAIGQYEKMSQLQPDNWQWHKKLGDLYQKQSQHYQTGEVVEGTALTLNGNSSFVEAAAAYESALQLEPNAYELYRSLAETYTKDGRPSDAEAVYRRALDAPLTQSQHDDAIKTIWAFYANKAHENKGIAILEELRQKMENSPVLHELLGDVYKKVGDTEKAENAYTQWIAIRQRQLNQRGSAGSYRDFAEKLLQKEIPPETAIKFAKRAVQISNNSDDILTLGYAYLVNGEYDIAVEQFKKGLLTLTSGTFQRKFFSWISEYGKKTQDKESYLDMLNELVNTTSDNVVIQLNLSLTLAEFCFNNNMPEKAKAYIQKTGFIAENAWWTLGPFDNTDGSGHNTTYIPEDTTQIDTATKYEGIDGQIRWQKSDDGTLDGYVGLGRDVDWSVAYAFATVVSPDARKVQLRFDSDDQGKVWLNGEEVHAHTRTYQAEIDRNIIPVTLKPGKNSILVKVCEEEGGWGFYLRITDTDGKPFNDLKIGGSD